MQSSPKWAWFTPLSCCRLTSVVSWSACGLHSTTSFCASPCSCWPSPSCLTEKHSASTRNAFDTTCSAVYVEVFVEINLRVLCVVCELCLCAVWWSWQVIWNCATQLLVSVLELWNYFRNRYIFLGYVIGMGLVFFYQPLQSMPLILPTTLRATLELVWHLL